MIFKVTFQPDNNVVIYPAAGGSKLTWTAKIGERYTSRGKSSGGGYATICLTEIDVEHQRVYGPSNSGRSRGRGRDRSMTLEQFVRAYAIPGQISKPVRPTATQAAQATATQLPAGLSELVKSVERVGAVSATVAAQSRRTNDLLLKISNTLEELLAAWTNPETKKIPSPSPSANGSVVEGVHSVGGPPFP